MTIASVRTAIARLANATLRTSYGANVSAREHVFVAVEDDGGTAGYGEGSPLPHFSGEWAAQMVPVIDAVLAPALIGIDPADLERAWLALNAATPGHMASKAALMNAVHDLAARRAGLPACALIGGAVRASVPTAGAVGIEADDTVIAAVARLFESGSTTVKLKIGVDLDRDIRIVRRLREEFPAALEIRADANAGMRFADAVRFLRAVEDCRLQYLEQPLARHDRDGLAALRGRGTPIAADESLYGLADALSLVGCVDVFIVKLIKLGGLWPARKVVSIAEAAGISCVAVSPYESSLGVAANLHLAAASPAFDKAAELGVGVSSVKLEGATELAIARGCMPLPAGRGLGVAVPESLFATGRAHPLVAGAKGA